MIRLQSLSISNFRGVREGKIDGFTDVNVLVGRNNSGKTTVVEAITRAAMAGGLGVALAPAPTGLPAHAWLFGEDQARYLVETGDPDRLLAEAERAGVPARHIGMVNGDELTLPGAGAISVAELKAANEAWLPDYMAQS